MNIAPTRSLPAWLTVPAFARFSGSAVLQFQRSNECDGQPALFITLKDKSGQSKRYELRNPQWKSWDDVDAWARKSGNVVNLAGVIKPVGALAVTQRPSDKLWNNIFRDTTHELTAHVSEYRMDGILVLDSISLPNVNPRPCDQW